MSELSQISKDMRAILKEKCPENLGQSFCMNNHTQIDELTKKLSELGDRGNILRRCLLTLESLHFSGIWARQNSIAIAHTATYDGYSKAKERKVIPI